MLLVGDFLRYCGTSVVVPKRQQQESDYQQIYVPEVGDGLVREARREVRGDRGAAFRDDRRQCDGRWCFHGDGDVAL